MPSVDRLLSVRGVIEPVANNIPDAYSAEREKAIIESLKKAIRALSQTRIEEGRSIGSILFNQIDSIRDLCNRADNVSALQPDNIRNRLKDQVEELLATTTKIPEDRIAQEVALLMVKLDVREELDRLGAHIESAYSLMNNCGIIGRRLDFLCQELNREANTLCAKSSDINLSRIGLELKSTIEQYREQVQNIE